MGHQKRIKDEKGRHKILVGILCLLTLGMWAASGTEVSMLTRDNKDYISLTDMVKAKDGNLGTNT